METALFLLIEKLVLSPTVQQAAWSFISPYLQHGITPPDSVIKLASDLADKAHANAQGIGLG